MSMKEPTQNAAGGEFALFELLCLAQRLRQCLRFDTPEESELEAAARDAANAFESMAVYAQRLEAWKAEGEKLIGKTGVGPAFELGAWWADRPWRNRDA